MKRILIAVAVAATALSAPVLATDLGVSVTIGQPGFYGRLDLGGFPPPPVIYRQPILIQPVPVHRPPIYLHVPPGHAKDWGKHCHKYDACGERVYFVRDDWYNREYVPRYQERYHNHRDHDRDGYRGNDRGDDKHGGRGKDHKREHGRGHDK